MPPEFYYMAGVAALGAIASVATCGFVIFMFKRLFANHDKLSQSLELLSETLSGLKLEVVGSYKSMHSCESCRKQLEAWITKVEQDIKDVDVRMQGKSEKFLSELAQLKERTRQFRNDVFKMQGEDIGGC